MAKVLNQPYSPPQDNGQPRVVPCIRHVSSFLSTTMDGPLARFRQSIRNEPWETSLLGPPKGFPRIPRVGGRLIMNLAALGPPIDGEVTEGRPGMLGLGMES